MLLEFGRQRSSQEQVLAQKLHALQCKLLDGIESTFALFHPPSDPVQAEPMPIDHLLARIQQLEAGLSAPTSSCRVGTTS